MDQDRKLAYDVLLDIEKNKAYSNLSIKNHLANNPNINGSFVRELVYGTLENQIYLDAIVDNLAAKGIKGIKTGSLCLIRMGLYQIIFMNSVPDYAAINETVKIAKKIAYGSEKFINGILRGYLKKKESTDFLPPKDDLVSYLSVKYSYKSWIVKLWEKQFIKDELEKLLDASNSKPRLCIRTNEKKITREHLIERLLASGFDAEKSLVSHRGILVNGNDILGSNLYQEGYFSVQDEASILAADTVSPGEDDFIIDMCAAPGGKTLAMGELIGKNGKIVAMDLYDHKLQLINEQANRLGIDCITTRQGDATKAIDKFIGKADKVLADVPCSGLGVIRHKPEIKLKDEQKLEELYDIQREILNNAGKYVKKDGILVYSTCTINKEENENKVQEFLKNNTDFQLIHSKQFLPHVDGTDGFYIAKLIRR